MKPVLCYRRADVLMTVISVISAMQGDESRVWQGSNIIIDKRVLEMMLLTIAVESDFVFRKQIGGGPERGLMGMEPATALDTFRYLERKPELWRRLTSLWIGMETVPFFTPTEEEVSQQLEDHDPFALGLGRVHYLMFPAPFPADLTNQAIYYKRFWNTPGGKSTVSDAVQKWSDLKCDRLMKSALKLCTLRA